jgi:hypothetical protein
VFGHQAVEYLVAMPPPCAIKTGKEALSEFLAVRVRPGGGRFLMPPRRWDSFLPRSFAAISVMATSFFAVRAMARITRCTEEPV